MTSEVEGFYERRRCRVELQEGTVEREDGVDPKVKSLDGLITRILSEVKSLSRVRLFATPWTVAYKAPPSMGFSRQEYWSGLPFPSLGDLPDPVIEPGAPALQADSLPSESPGNLLSPYLHRLHIPSCTLMYPLPPTSSPRCLSHDPAFSPFISAS